MQTPSPAPARLGVPRRPHCLSHSDWPARPRSETGPRPFAEAECRPCRPCRSCHSQSALAMTRHAKVRRLLSLLSSAVQSLKCRGHWPLRDDHRDGHGSGTSPEEGVRVRGSHFCLLTTLVRRRVFFAHLSGCSQLITGGKGEDAPPSLVHHCTPGLRLPVDPFRHDTMPAPMHVGVAVCGSCRR